MKISESTSYPHPVLAPWSEDISGSSIATTLAFRENEEAGQVSVHCEAKLDHPDLLRLISEGTATFGCYIRCLDTGFRRLQPFGFPAGNHDFAPGALLGRVQLRPMVWSVEEIDGYQPAGAHPEFAGGHDIAAGQILALDDEQIIDVSRPPLPSVESIFDIDWSEEVADGQFQVDTDDDRIIIRMSVVTHALVQSLRDYDDLTRAAVMNGLYVPVMMEVLDTLAGGVEQYEQYRWYQPFRARCEQVGIDLDNPDSIVLINDAHKLLALPFGLLELLVGDEDTQEEGAVDD